MALDWGGGDRDKRCFAGRSGRFGDLSNIKKEEGEEDSKNDSKY